MPLHNTASTYGSVARGFHWAMAILIIVGIALIELRGLAPRGSALRAGLRDWHGQVGLIVLALVWFRLAWKLNEPRPGIEPAPPGWQLRAAHAVAWAFYAIMIVQPILGFVMTQMDGKQLALLGVSLPTLVAPDKVWAHRLEDVHELIGNLMIVLIAIHVVAAIWHALARRDNTLARML